MVHGETSGLAREGYDFFSFGSGNQRGKVRSGGNERGGILGDLVSGLCRLPNDRGGYAVATLSVTRDFGKRWRRLESLNRFMSLLQTGRLDNEIRVREALRRNVQNDLLRLGGEGRKPEYLRSAKKRHRAELHDYSVGVAGQVAVMEADKLAVRRRLF
jgi:hypothetical protein